MSISRAGTLEHIGALDVVYAGIIERAHLESPAGSLTTGNASTEKTAAKRAKKR